MALDHQHTADQIVADIKVLDESLIHAETVGQVKIWNSIKQHLYGVADHHEDKAQAQQKEEQNHNLSQLHKSADQALTKTS